MSPEPLCSDTRIIIRTVRAPYGRSTVGFHFSEAFVEFVGPIDAAHFTLARISRDLVLHHWELESDDPPLPTHRERLP